MTDEVHVVDDDDTTQIYQYLGKGWEMQTPSLFFGVRLTTDASQFMDKRMPVERQHLCHTTTIVVNITKYSLYLKCLLNTNQAANRSMTSTCRFVKLYIHMVTHWVGSSDEFSLHHHKKSYVFQVFDISHIFRILHQYVLTFYKI